MVEKVIFIVDFRANVEISTFKAVVTVKGKSGNKNVQKSVRMTIINRNDSSS